VSQPIILIKIKTISAYATGLDIPPRRHPSFQFHLHSAVFQWNWRWPFLPHIFFVMIIFGAVF